MSHGSIPHRWPGAVPWRPDVAWLNEYGNSEVEIDE